MDNRLKLILYGGTSFSTLQTFSRVIPGLVGMGIQPVLMFVKDPVTKNPAAFSDEMKEFGFFHSRLMNETIIPFMDSRDPILDSSNKALKKLTYTPRQLCKIYAESGLKAYELDDVNSPAHVDYIKSDPNIILGLSEKCRQVFEQPIIDAHRGKKNLPGEGRGHLMNIHPGRLPQLRGLFPVAQAIRQKKPYIVSTLHAIEKGGVQAIDTGTVYDTAQQDVDFTKSVLEHYSATSDRIPSMILKNVDDVLNHGAPLDQVQQDQSEANYFSWITPNEIQEIKDNGGVWVGQRAVETKLLTSAFANGSHHGHHLRATVADAVNAEYGRPVSVPKQATPRKVVNMPSPHKGLTPIGQVA